MKSIDSTNDAVLLMLFEIILTRIRIRLVQRRTGYNDPMIPALEEEYADSDKALMALATRTENASNISKVK